MSKKQKSTQSGVSNEEMIEGRQGSQSTNAGNPSTSDTLGQTVPKKSSSQRMKNSPVDTNVGCGRIIQALAKKLGKLVEWKKLQLADGRVGWALFFHDKKWKYENGELVPS